MSVVGSAGRCLCVVSVISKAGSRASSVFRETDIRVYVWFLYSARLAVERDL